MNDDESRSVELDAVSGYDGNDRSRPMAGANVNDASKGRPAVLLSGSCGSAEVPATRGAPWPAARLAIRPRGSCGRRAGDSLGTNAGAKRDLFVDVVDVEDVVNISAPWEAEKVRSFTS